MAMHRHAVHYRILTFEDNDLKNHQVPVSFIVATISYYKTYSPKILKIFWHEFVVTEDQPYGIAYCNSEHVENRQIDRRHESLRDKLAVYSVV